MCPHPLIPDHVGFSPRNHSMFPSFFFSRGYVFFFFFLSCMWALPCSAEATIRMRTVGIPPKTPAIKKYPHGDKEKESRTHHGFYKLVMVLLRFPAAERIYCKGKSTNNCVAWAPTVSKMLFRELQLNFLAPRCHKDRAEVFTEIPRGEIRRLHTSLTGCLSQSI